MRSDILASDTCLIFFYNNWTRALAVAVAVGPQQAPSSHSTRRHAWSVRLMGRRAVSTTGEVLTARASCTGRGRRLSRQSPAGGGRHCTVVVAHVTAGMHAGYVRRRPLAGRPASARLGCLCLFIWLDRDPRHACKLMSTRRGRVS